MVMFGFTINYSVAISQVRFFFFWLGKLQTNLILIVMKIGLITLVLLSGFSFLISSAEIKKTSKDSFLIFIRSALVWSNV